MPVQPLVPGLPGFRAAISATPKIIFKGGIPQGLLPQGRVIDGSNARDAGNNPVTTLRAGMLMGKMTGTPVIGTTGQWGASIIDTLGVAFTSGTSMTISAAGAAELVRRLGSSGTFQLIGPAAAGGTLQSVSVTYSAVNQTTGVITVTDPGMSFILGAFVCPQDGSQNILSFIPDGTGITVVDTDGITSISQQFPEVPIEGTIISANLINWPTDTSLQAYIVERLNNAAGGKYIFDHIF